MLTKMILNLNAKTRTKLKSLSGTRTTLEVREGIIGKFLSILGASLNCVYNYFIHITTYLATCI